MTPNQTLSSLTSHAIRMLDGYLAESRPDMVLVQGDTTTVFAAALASFYHRIPVGHIEAGLRTWNRYSPFPEELNRVLTTRLAELHFAPTGQSKNNLIGEGVGADTIFITGNTVIDSLLMMTNKIKGSTVPIPGLPDSLLNGQKTAPIVLVTGHRRENFGEGFLSICRALGALAETFRDVHFVYPVHLNPSVQKPVYSLLSGRENIHLIDPLSYVPFIALMQRSAIILTDSGGVQEEAPSLGKPVLVMRDTTERPEAIVAGTGRMVGTNERRIIDEVSKLLTDENEYRAMSHAVNPYGDGRATDRIVRILRHLFYQHAIPESFEPSIDQQTTSQPTIAIQA